MVHLKSTPPQYCHLSGLMNVFKSKIGLTSVMSGSTRVSARFTYVLKDWGETGKWPSKLPDSEALSNHYGSLLCGCFEDPVGELQLAVTWPCMIGDMVIDNEIHSYFKPLTAPCWSIRLGYKDDVCYLLSSYLFEFLKLTDRSESMIDLLNLLHDEPEKNMSQALSKITDPRTAVIPIVPVKLASGITKVVSDPQALLRKGAYTLGRIATHKERIAKDVLIDIKSFLFFETPTEEEISPNKRNLTPQMHTLSHKLKAAPVNSLTYRLAMCALVVTMCHGGLSALAQLWHLLVSELRSLLDTGMLLPGIEGLQPDLRTCLLHQKLQMLNYCIHCKRQREMRMAPGENCSSFQSTSDEQLSKTESDYQMKDSENLASSAKFNDLKSAGKDEETNTKQIEILYGHTNSKLLAAATSEDSDDEFFECKSVASSSFEEKPEINLSRDNTFTIQTESGYESNKNFNKILSHAPEGRLNICKNLKLLHCDSALFIPITQDHPPMTEDLLEEQADVFSKLGDTTEGSKVRAKMQSASLLSDMQAFKAANPGCCMEDFLCWYSPKDFENGKLSERMQMSNNLWVTTWDTAKPVPVTRQNRLFDDTKEAEKALHFLTNLKPNEICQMLLPICVHEALISISSVSQSMAECLPSLPLICEQIEMKASRLFRHWKMHGSVSNQFVPWNDGTRAAVNDLFAQISFAESLIERARSLRHKFAALEDEHVVSAFIRKLLEHPEVPLNGAADGKEGNIVRGYFQRQQNKIREARNIESTNPGSGEESSKGPAPVLPEPTGREFVIRAVHPYPTSSSRELPHRFYAVLMRNEFRLAAAVSSDSTFF